jgi:hypothetical protein
MRIKYYPCLSPPSAGAASRHRRHTLCTRTIVLRHSWQSKRPPPSAQYALFMMCLQTTDPRQIQQVLRCTWCMQNALPWQGRHHRGSRPWRHTNCVLAA